MSGYGAEICGNTLNAALPGGNTALFAAIRFKAFEGRAGAAGDK